MPIYIDQWRTPPIPIPARPTKNMYAKIGTKSNEYTLIVESVSADLCRGRLLESPPQKKKDWTKHDRFIFHIEHILELGTFYKN